MQHRTRLALAACVALAFAPAVGSAQGKAARSADELGGRCDAATCSWLVFVDDAPVGSLRFATATASALELNRPVPFAADAESFVSLADCAACKSNSRPFVVPPGILKKLTKHHRLQGQTGVDNDEDGDDLDAGEVVQGSGVPGQVASSAGAENPGAQGTAGATSAGPTVPQPAATGGTGQGTSQGTGQGTSGGIAVAATPAVIVTPEPGAFVLLATGLVALIPVVRSRRRDS